jgi:hypothetical protein
MRRAGLAVLPQANRCNPGADHGDDAGTDSANAGRVDLAELP